MRLLLVAVLAFSLILASPVMTPRVHAGIGCSPGATICTNIVGSGNWENQNTWIDVHGIQRLPTASDDVDLVDLDVTIHLNSVQIVHSIHIAGLAGLYVEAAATLTILSHTPVGPSDNEGELVVFGKVVNHAAFVDTVMREIDILPGGIFVNYDSLDISEGDFTNLGTFVNVCNGHVIEGPEFFQKLSGDVTHEPCPVVGGVVEPVNNLVMLSPWLAVIGMVGCVATAAVVAKKRHP